MHSQRYRFWCRRASPSSHFGRSNRWASRELYLKAEAWFRKFCPMLLSQQRHRRKHRRRKCRHEGYRYATSLHIHSPVYIHTFGHSYMYILTASNLHPFRYEKGKLASLLPSTRKVFDHHTRCLRKTRTNPPKGC